MTDLEVSNFIRRNYKASIKSLAMRSSICGIGINDADYLTNPKVNGKVIRCPAYVAWSSMITRAYSQKYHAKFPTYRMVEVCEEWKSFMEFRKWWVSNQVDGWQLDKDLLSDQLIYSPETCVYVPCWMNAFTIDSGAARGLWPIGVHLHKPSGKFNACCRNPKTAKEEHVGLFISPDSAHQAWKSRKIGWALALKRDMDDIDARIYPRVIEIIERAK